MIDIKNLAKNKHQDKNSRQSPDLVDIRHIQIDTDLPVCERSEKYVEEIQNPYHFLCGR